jgi:2-succinyl-6-hydroxy-2,4-cyclohexadiene-1-carboxylate synthase
MRRCAAHSGELAMHRVTLVHGFLGSPEDWDGVAAALGPGAHCERIDLHALGCETLAAAGERLAGHVASTAPSALVGYSLGGRIALVAAAQGVRIPVVLLAASPGIEDPAERSARAREDDARAASIRRDGLAEFVGRWYAMPMFDRLRSHEGFASVRDRRARGDGEFWARCVAGCSPGRAASAWGVLPGLAPGSAYAVGTEDDRYSSLADRVAREAPHLRVERIEGAGHALPIEAPERCAALIEHALRNAP